MPKTQKDWSLINLPPQGHADVAEFAAGLFEIAKTEKERLGKPADFLYNYALYRGRHPKSIAQGAAAYGLPPSLVNLYFANVERTVSNITARKPTGEVVDLDGGEEQDEQTLSMALQKWWQETNQQGKTRSSARTMEIYGVTAEKPFWNRSKEHPGVEVVDPFAVFPAPGNYDNLSEDCPYVCFCYLDFVDQVERKYDVEGVAEEEAYELMGQEREEYKSDGARGKGGGLGNYSETPYRTREEAVSDAKVKRCLVTELWIRDGRKKTVKEEYAVIDPETEQPIIDEAGMPVVEVVESKTPVYRDGIRMISFTRAKSEGKGEGAKQGKSGWMTLHDGPNPNLNPKLNDELAQTTYPWGRIPVYHANSYRDPVSVWGFAAAEQVGDLLHEINTIIRSIISYVKNCMRPPLIIQQHCGISRAMVESNLQKGGRLVLMPTTPNARIEFMQIPNLPQTFFQALQMIINYFDRVYQIEEADRGEAPNGVIAAAAIQALQERNAVLMQAKTTSIDSLVENRSRWAVGLWQNFGSSANYVNVNGDSVEFIGARYAGRKFNFTVEAGSTMPRTQLQVQEMAVQLYQAGALSRKGLLKNVNWPDWKEEVERGAEGSLEQAMQILIDAGLSEEQAQTLYQYLAQDQGGPGDTQQKEQGGERKKEKANANV